MKVYLNSVSSSVLARHDNDKDYDSIYIGAIPVILPDNTLFNSTFSRVLSSDNQPSGWSSNGVLENNLGGESIILDPVRAVEIANSLKPLTSGDPFIQQFSGRFLLDPNEVNGFGQGGFTDETLSRDLGNADATTLTRLSGGFMFPYDIRLDKFRVWHRNNNNSAEAWGWVISKQAKTAGSNAVTTTFIVHEAQSNGNVGPRNYLNTQNQFTDLDLSGLANNTLAAGEVLTIGVAAPTANTTNYYVECMSGMISANRI